MFNLVLMCKLTTTTLAPLPLPCLQVTIHRILKKKASDISKKTYGKCSEGITYC